jgi:hypothetical protein
MLLSIEIAEKWENNSENKKNGSSGSGLHFLNLANPRPVVAVNLLIMEGFHFFCHIIDILLLYISIGLASPRGI